MAEEPFDRLEQLVADALRGQAELRAPGTLARRVECAVAKWDARPWWRRAFAEWPLAMRVAFVVISTGAAVLCIGAAGTFWNGPAAAGAAALAQQWALLEDGVRTTGGAVARWLGNVSPGWFYLGAAVIASIHLALFGLGAVAYRVLWKAR